MDVRSGVTSSTPENVFIDAGAVYFDYGLATERLLGATRGGNEFNTNRVSKNIEADGIKGAVKGMKRITEVNPQITVNMLELSIDNLIKSIAGANQSDRITIDAEHIAGAAQAEFDLLQNDVVENSEIVYVKDATGLNTLVKQTRSKDYSSRFVGSNAADNKEFESGIGDWEEDSDYDPPTIDTGGLSGNCLKFIGKVAATELTFLTLPATGGAVLTNLIVDEYYRLRIVIGDKEANTWSGGAITVKCTGGATSITVADPKNTTWVVYEIVFKATGTDATITLTAAATIDAGTDIVYIDYLELKKVDYPSAAQIALGQFGYIVKQEGGTGKKASVILMAALASGDDIVISYTYVPSTASDAVDTTITGGEIEDSDYITNVAIVGNVSGKTYPVICIVKNALAEGPFSLSTAPRDEAVPSIVFTGHYDPSDLDDEPWEVKYPKT